MIFGWTGFLLTLVGFFYAWLVWMVFFVAMAVLIIKEIRNKNYFKTSKELLLVTLGIVIFTVTLSFFTTPTIFSGRDQGTISESAIRLAQNHKLTFSTPASDVFFQLRGPGKALNFPGFFYTNSGKLITQFPLAYTAWLATFYGIFGIAGFVIANAVLSIFFLVTFYLLARLFMPIRSSVVSLLLIATSLSIYWFPKYTLSENLALTLLWVSIFSLITFLKKQTELNFLLLLASSTLLAFARIEGMAFLFVSVAIVFFNKKTLLYLKDTFHSKFFFILSFFLLVFLVNFFWDINFYKELIKAIIPNLAVPQASQLGILNDSALPKFYILKIFQLYGMLSFFLVSAIALFLYALRRDTLKLVPFFVIAPTLIYFFDSHISPDHPWMLRRFTFAILPVAIFYCSLLISDLSNYLSSHKKNLATKTVPPIIIIFLLVGNMPAFLHFATFSENKNLLKQTEKISDLFSSNDLILIDSQATGDGWAMISGPMNFLYLKNSVYFFNPQDISKLDFKSFKDVYLITSDSKIPFYTNSTIGKMLVPVDQFTFETSQLELKSNAGNVLTHFPEKRSSSTHGIIFKVLK